MSFVEFYGSLDYSSLYRSMQLDVMKLLWKKIFSIEKLSLVDWEGMNIWWGESTVEIFPGKRDD